MTSAREHSPCDRRYGAALRYLPPGQSSLHEDSQAPQRRDSEDASCTEPTPCDAWVSINRTGPATTVLTLGGEIDLSSVESVRPTVLDTVAASTGHLIAIELDRVRLLAAHGVALLVAAHSAAAAHDAVLRLVLDPASPAARAVRCFPDSLPFVPTLADVMAPRRRYPTTFPP